MVSAMLLFLAFFRSQLSGDTSCADCSDSLMSEIMVQSASPASSDVASYGRDITRSFSK